MSMPEPALALRGVTKAFGFRRVLRGIDLDIPAGQRVVLFGPNGAGKTTLLRILAALSRPTTGRIRVGGYELRNQPEAVRAQLGLVTHAPLLYDTLTASENLHFYGGLYDVPHLDERVDALLEIVGLRSRRNDLVRTFSRGMVQRLTIARALLHDPAILLLDEPDTGLDPQAAETLDRLLAEVGRAASARQRTVLMTTHHLERGLATADRVLILAEGRLVYDQPSAAITSGEVRALYHTYVGSPFPMGAGVRGSEAGHV